VAEIGFALCIQWWTQKCRFGDATRSWTNDLTTISRKVQIHC